jgi:hypothetical protein
MIGTCRKAVRATVVLLPLLGISYVIFITNPGDSNVSKQVFVYFNSVLQSTQVSTSPAWRTCRHGDTCRKIAAPVTGDNSFITFRRCPIIRLHLLRLKVILTATDRYVGGRLQQKRSVGDVLFLVSESNSDRNCCIILRRVNSAWIFIEEQAECSKTN